jgi:hypothetical protein
VRGTRRRARDAEKLVRPAGGGYPRRQGIGATEAAMFDRFTDGARKVMALARKEAHRFSHDFIGTEHILLSVPSAPLWFGLAPP